MGYGKDVWDISKSILNDRRHHAQRGAEQREAALFKKIPKAYEIHRKIASCGTLAARAVLNGGDAAKAIKELKEENLKLRKELKNLLIDNGYNEKYLDVQYACSRCEDTGFYEVNNITNLCECFKKLLAETAYEALNALSPLKLSTFETFQLNKYSRETDEGRVVPYDRMAKIFKFCKDYALSFTASSSSLLMRGETGLGKTHLSLAIANEVIKKGYGVVYMSAPNLLSQLEKEHFSGRYSNEEQTLSLLTDCDLLILDGLGTEFSTSFSVSAVYNIVNTRILHGKPIIFNTNYTIKELEKAYSQRFVSRVTGSNFIKLDFVGKDIRACLGRI